jgi:uncharacterized membrane protein
MAANVLSARAEKDLTVDVLRGAAIFTMIAANMAGEILAPEHPFLFRVYGSFAAPMFILLSGMMVFRAAQAKDYPLRHFMVRGLLIVAVGALIDLADDAFPLTTFDVLYLIGVATPLAFLLRLHRPAVRWATVALLFGLAPALQHFVGYAIRPWEVPLERGLRAWAWQTPTNLRHFLVDGWFPVFPWLGFAFLGVCLGDLRWRPDGRRTFASRRFVIAGLAALAVGAALFWRFPGELYVRRGYSELFYPPTIGYLLVAVGVIVLAFAVADRRPDFAVYAPLRALGQCALFMYVVHLAVIDFILSPLFPESPLPRFLVVYLVTAAALIGVAYGVRWLKKRWPNRPYLVRFLLGG